MNIAQFRLDFPEFADTVRYSDAQLTFWATVAERQVNVNAWGDAASFGVNLYVAHEITLAAENLKSAANGAAPGSQSGPVNNKAVGAVSVGYDTAQAAEKDAGWWNLTTYGKQFYRLSQMYGAGAIQLGTGYFNNRTFGRWCL